ncbi:hypothetical protein BDV12DRAFT_14822 [Aspergillus spectabilis]
MSVRFDVKYCPITEHAKKYAIWDLSPIQDSPRYQPSTFTEVLEEFLLRFHDFKAHLAGHFGPTAEDILVSLMPSIQECIPLRFHCLLHIHIPILIPRHTRNRTINTRLILRQPLCIHHTFLPLGSGLSL